MAMLYKFSPIPASFNVPARMSSDPSDPIVTKLCDSQTMALRYSIGMASVVRDLFPEEVEKQASGSFSRFFEREPGVLDSLLILRQ